jgi:uncharacterized membrane protein
LEAAVNRRAREFLAILWAVVLVLGFLIPAGWGLFAIVGWFIERFGPTPIFVALTIFFCIWALVAEFRGSRVRARCAELEGANDRLGAEVLELTQEKRRAERNEARREVWPPRRHFA